MATKAVFRWRPDTRRRWLISLVLLVGIVALYHVVEFTKTDPGAVPAVPCRTTETRSEQLRCWTDLLDTTLNAEGIQGAFTLLAELYVSQPGFREACHGLTHRIGAAAAKEFMSHGNVAAAGETALCNYGYYHGFVETLLLNGGTLADARSLCTAVGSTLAATTPDTELQCFHGIGHGVVNGHEPRLWGNERTMVAQALPVCEGVANTPDQLYRCATGVFNGIAAFYTGGEYGLSMADINPDNPLRICREQAPKYRKPCYNGMRPVVVKLSDQDFSQMLAIAEQIPDEEDITSAIWPLAEFHILLTSGRSVRADDIRICRGLRESLRLSCIRGLAVGFLWHGVPGTEYEEALRFCNTEELSEQERRACFDAIAFQLAGLYPAPRVPEMCQAIPAPYRSNCGRAPRYSEEVPSWER